VLSLRRKGKAAQTEAEAISATIDHSNIRGSCMVLLLWFYLSGVAILLGAEFNSVLEDAAAKAGAPDAKEKGEKASGQPSPSRA
jgi:hypothetical protein